MGIEVPWKGLKTYFGGSEMISRRGVRNFINLCSSYQLSGLVVGVSSLCLGGWEFNPWPSHSKEKLIKWWPMPPCLALSIKGWIEGEFL